MMEKMKVGSLLCEEDNEGSCLLSFSDSDAQVEAAVWNVEVTSKVAHMLSSDFIQWLISQANEGKWSKEEVSSIVCRKNADNHLVLATLDEETKKQVAVFNKPIVIATHIDAIRSLSASSDGLWLCTTASDPVCNALGP